VITKHSVFSLQLTPLYNTHTDVVFGCIYEQLNQSMVVVKEHQKCVTSHKSYKVLAT